MAVKLSSLAQVLDALAAQLHKARTEIIKEVGDLQEACKNVPIPEDAEASLGRLMAIAQALDDLNADDES